MDNIIYNLINKMPYCNDYQLTGFFL